MERRDGHATTRRRQRGQSLVEVAVACIVLVPMLLLVMLLGQYIHIHQNTQAAARAAAWDATAASGYQPDARAKTELRLRVRQFSNVGQGLANNEKAPKKLADPMLTTFAGRELVKPADVRLQVYTNTAASDYMSKAFGQIGKITSKFGLGAFPPDRNGTITAEVHAHTQKILSSDGKAADWIKPFDRDPLDFGARNVLLADAWNASGAGENRGGDPVKIAYNNRSVRSQIRLMVPTEWLGDSGAKAVEKVFDFMSDLPLPFFSGRGKLQLGKAAPDVVPADRLVKYGPRR